MWRRIFSSARSSISRSSVPKSAPGTGTWAIRSGKPANRLIVICGRSVSIHFEVEELGGALVEQQRDLAGRAVTVLRDVQIGDALLLAVLVVVIVPVDEHHEVGVLLDGA